MASRTFKTPLSPEEQWSRDRARIHVLKGKVEKAQPGFDNDNYRDIILDVSQGRADSSKDLTPRERRELIDRLSVLAGEQSQPHFNKGGRRTARGFPGRPKNMDKPGESRAEQLGKIEALLTVGKRPWSYADAIARAICRVDKVAWVKDSELYKIITALRKQAKREGWDLSGEKR